MLHINTKSKLLKMAYSHKINMLLLGEWVDNGEGA